MDDVEDIMSDALELLGDETVKDTGCVQYGPLRLTVAPKVINSSLIGDSVPSLIIASFFCFSRA